MANLATINREDAIELAQTASEQVLDLQDALRRKSALLAEANKNKPLPAVIEATLAGGTALALGYLRGYGILETADGVDKGEAVIAALTGAAATAALVGKGANNAVIREAAKAAESVAIGGSNVLLYETGLNLGARHKLAAERRRLEAEAKAQSPAAQQAP